MSSPTTSKAVQDPPSIIPSISLETLNPDLFRSQMLWTPKGARGVFGGQIIGQALNAATQTVGSTLNANTGAIEKVGNLNWGMHSMHCYFLLPCSEKIPVLYNVQRLRDGKSFSSRSVVATQNAIPIFMLTCSFCIPSPYAQPTWSEPMPDLRFFLTDNESLAAYSKSLSSGDATVLAQRWRLPGPNECQLEEDRWRDYLNGPNGKTCAGKPRVGIEAYIEERAESPIAIKEVLPSMHVVPDSVALSLCEKKQRERAGKALRQEERPLSDNNPQQSNPEANGPAAYAQGDAAEDGGHGDTHSRDSTSGKRKLRNKRMLWMKSRDESVVNSGAGFEKCILAYISDFQFVGTAALSVGLGHTSHPRLGMMASLDHSCFFYSSTFTTSQWLLHVMESPRVSDGRGVVVGRFYTQEGELIAVTSQEGVVRAQKGWGEIKGKL